LFDARERAVTPPLATDGEVAQAVRAMAGKPLRIFLFCLAIWSLTNMDQSLFGYAMPGILSDLHIGLGAVAVVLSIGFAFTMAAAVVGGLAADRFGRRLVLAICLGLSGLFVGFQGLVHSVVMLTVVRALAFGFSGGLSPITNAFVAESAPPRIRGVLVGLLQCGYPIGWFIASMFVVPLMTHYGWRATFLVGFAIVPLSFIVYRLVPESPRFETVRATQANQAPWRASLAELFSGPRLKPTLLIGFAFFAQGGAYAGSAFYLPTFFHVVRGYGEAEAARIVGLSYGIGVLGYIGASLIGEFVWTRRNTIVAWCWLGAVTFLGFVWLPGSVPEDIAWCGVMAIFFYGSVAIMGTYMLELYPTRLRATGAAVNSAFLSLGFATFPVMVAHLVEVAGWQQAFSALIPASLLLCGLAMLGLENFASGRPVEDV
jgi:MFS family permease